MEPISGAIPIRGETAVIPLKWGATKNPLLEIGGEAVSQLEYCVEKRNAHAISFVMWLKAKETTFMGLIAPWRI